MNARERESFLGKIRSRVRIGNGCPSFTRRDSDCVQKGDVPAAATLDASEYHIRVLSIRTSVRVSVEMECNCNGKGDDQDRFAAG